MEGDLELVERFRSGDDAAFAAIYVRYRPVVQAVLRERVRCREDAEDLAQETFEIAYRALARFEGRSRLSTWLVGIAKNVQRRAHRHASRWVTTGRAVDPFEDAGIGVDARLEDRADAHRVLGRCDSILAHAYGEAQREIFRLRYGENHSIRSVAVASGRSTDAVKASLSRMRKTLAERLSDVPHVRDARRAGEPGVDRAA